MQGYFTTKGMALSAKLLTGAVLTISRVVAGSGQTPATAATLSAPCQTLAVNSSIRSGNTASIAATLVAASASGNYTLTELGVYARDPDEGEILYKIYKLSTPVNVVAGSRLVLRFYLGETISGTETVSVVCSPDGLLTEGHLPALLERLSVPKSRTLHVAKTGSDATGTGTEANPYLTIQKALDALPKYLSGATSIKIHAGEYPEDLNVQWFGGPGHLNLEGISGETVTVRTISMTYCNADRIALTNLTLNGEASHRESLYVAWCCPVYVNGLVCTETQSGNNGYGAIFASYRSLVYLTNCQISNKAYAVDVMGGTVYLTRTVMGTGNTVAIRCGSSWGGYGGYVQKGGATIEGAEQTAYGGQIY